MSAIKFFCPSSRINATIRKEFDRGTRHKCELNRDECYQIFLSE
nr:MAG TPA: hypothetical protein [Caudoviricetes sp.]